ncbi:A/G-specific adenine glycosylase, partial [Magnetococcales bacterium HHB-1]
MVTLPADPEQLSRTLLEFYAKSGRNLPWRQNREPYRIWLSEIMLQQTGAATVIPYYERFLKRFPKVEILAASPLGEVLSHWQGLGYYRRAHHLHETAQKIVARFDGDFPKTVEAWKALPGIGESTAAAIVAIAFNKKATILDGNVKRVLSRLTAFDQPLNRAAPLRALWHLARMITPEEAAGDYAQAIMDLGATCCTPRKPQCPICPWIPYCRAHKEDDPLAYPKSNKRKKTAEKYQVCLLVLDPEQRLLLRQRPEKGLLAGLWEPLGTALFEKPFKAPLKESI